MSYADDLKHPLWQKFRLGVLEAAGWRCARCGEAERQLHAHHKVYIRARRPWEYAPEMLECLCDPCHVKAHEDREALDIAVSMRSTRELPAMLRIINRVNGVMAADSQRSRADAINRLLDELDCVADDQRAFEAMP